MPDEAPPVEKLCTEKEKMFVCEKTNTPRNPLTSCTRNAHFSPLTALQLKKAPHSTCHGMDQTLSVRYRRFSAFVFFCGPSPGPCRRSRPLTRGRGAFSPPDFCRPMKRAPRAGRHGRAREGRRKGGERLFIIGLGHAEGGAGNLHHGRAAVSRR